MSFNHERDTRYETYRKASISGAQQQMESYENRGLIVDADIGGGRSDIPQVYVEHHDEAYEMESRRELR